jgi:hypothetical protein
VAVEPGGRGPPAFPKSENVMKDDVIIIAGATSGIGKACAFEYGRNGAIVIVTGRDQTKKAIFVHTRFLPFDESPGE